MENKKVSHLMENKKVSHLMENKWVSHLIEGEYFRVLIVRLPSSECWGTMLSFYFEEKLLFWRKHFILRETFYFEEKLSFWHLRENHNNSWCILKVWRMNSKSERTACIFRNKRKIIPLVTCHFLKDDLSPSTLSFFP